MALTGTSRGQGGNNTASASLAFAPSGNLAAGSMAVAVIACDNAGSGGASSAITGVTDTKGNTWTRRVNPIFDNGAASAGVELCFWTTPQNGGALTTGDTITVAFSPNVTAKNWALHEVVPGAGNTVSYITGAAGTGSTTGTPTVTTSSITSGDMVIGGGASESASTWTGDGDSTNGSWSAQQANGAGTGTSGNALTTQRKIVTATATQTYNPTLTSVDVILGWIQLREVTPPALSVVAYRFRNDDGSETTATWKAAQNTDVSMPEGTTFRLRFEIQETNGVAVNGTDADFGLTRRLNGGSWIMPNAESATVLMPGTSSNVADTDATTDQLTAGTGTFGGGTIEELNARVNGTAIAANGHVEYEFVLEVLAADVVDGDVIEVELVQYPVAYGGPANRITLTNTQSPTITVGTGETPKTASDSGSGSDATSAADRTAVDTGAGAEGTPTIAQAATADTGALTGEVANVGQAFPVTDTGALTGETSTTTATYTATDTGSGAETATKGVIATDAGALASELAGVSSPVTATDSGALTAETATKGVLATDAGSGADSTSSRDSQVVDTAAGADTAIATKLTTDAGALTSELATLSVPIAGTDTGALTAEVSALTISTADTGSGTEGGSTISTGVVDSAAGADSTAVRGAAVLEVGALASELSTRQADGDFQGNETGSGSDATSARDIVAADAGTSTELVSMVDRALNDSGSGGDSSTGSAASSATDTGAGLEVLVALAVAHTAADSEVLDLLELADAEDLGSYITVLPVGAVATLLPGRLAASLGVRYAALVNPRTATLEE
jgi:hypothetical protein